MSLFPHDDHYVLDIESRASGELAEIVSDPGLPLLQRDQALWNLIYRQQRNSAGFLLRLASDDESEQLRHSASWGLLKLGHSGPLRECLSPTDSGNVRAWKLHLLREADGDSSPFEDRPVRQVESRFDFTMPLHIEGVVQFRGEDGRWRQGIVGQQARIAMVGALTAGIRMETFTTDLVMQKRIPNIFNSGTDFIEGYVFRGISRPSGVNTITHYYESIWQHSFYLSGRSGDDSAGVIENVPTYLRRIAETDLAQPRGVPFAYPQSVRGVFYGSVHVHPEFERGDAADLDGTMQIISTADARTASLANGWFYGTFRGVPEDVDGDGTVELNGAEMFVDTDGRVLNQRPESGSKS